MGSYKLFGQTREITILFISIVFLSTKAIAGGEYAITTSKVNLRESNTKNSKSLRILDQGDTLEILSTQYNWTKVKVKNLEGYVSSKYILRTGEANSTKEERNKEDTFSELFKHQKGFIGGFKFIFINTFIVLFLVGGGITTYFLRKKDARYKKGYKEEQMNSFSIFKLALYCCLASLLAGFIGGIIAMFN